jgi:ubiquinone/menaquinone biosynthesis C-methylase UbiE
MNDKKIRNEVKDFYNQVGWQTIGDTLYQNAQYEDLRPVSQEYLHRCHLRVKRHLAQEGTYFLDAGSGPVQYPEYLTYSAGYRARVCMDLSIVALREARKRVGEHGFYVVADIAHLPFKSNLFDGISALHTIHHVPMDEKILAYEALFRTLKPGRQMVVVDGWTHAPLMNRLSGFMDFVKRLRAWRSKKKVQHSTPEKESSAAVNTQSNETIDKAPSSPAGTFVEKFDADGLIELLSGKMDYEILVWRSVSVSFLRAVMLSGLGRAFLAKSCVLARRTFPQVVRTNWSVSPGGG